MFRSSFAPAAVAFAAATAGSSNPRDPTSVRKPLGNIFINFSLMFTHL